MFKLFAQGCSDDELELHSTYPDELSANIKAKDLYCSGLRTVVVRKPDGSESLLWCKPEFQHGGVK